MKMYHARHPFGRSFIIRHVVSRHPVFVAPDITQEHEHETGEIEDELFYRHRAAARGDVNAERGGARCGAKAKASPRPGSRKGCSSPACGWSTTGHATDKHVERASETTPP